MPETGGVKWDVHFEDCLSGLSRLPEKSIHCIVTDPPYGMNYVSNRRTHESDIVRAINNDQKFDPVWFDKALVALERVLVDDAHVYVFASDGVAGHMQQVFERYFTFKNWLIWDKKNHTAGDLDGAYGKQCEFILFGHKGRRPLQRGRPSSLIAFPKIDSTDMLHVSQKPLPLISFLIENSTKPGEIVCDPFIGSGTTAIASVKLGRSFVGYENDDANYKIAIARIERELAQGSLF